MENLGTEAFRTCMDSVKYRLTDDYVGLIPSMKQSSRQMSAAIVSLCDEWRVAARSVSAAAKAVEAHYKKD